MPRGIHRLLVLAAATAGLGIAGGPASALATDRYVDNNSMGLPPCTNPAFPCTTIAQAMGVPAVAGDVVHVGGSGGSPYAGNVTVPDGVSLVKDSFTSPFDTSGPATIGAGTETTTALILGAGTSPRTISGFTLRGANQLGNAIIDSLGGTYDNVTIAGNTFDAHQPNSQTDIDLAGGNPKVTDNTFIGNSDDVRRLGVVYNGHGTHVEVDHNSFDSYMAPIAISAFGGAPIVDVHDNTALNLYDDTDPSLEAGIAAIGASGSVTRNLLTEQPGQVSGSALFLTGPAVATGTPLVVSDNRAFGFAGDSEFAGPDAILLANDVFSNDGAAFLALNSPSVTATNITATNSTGGAGYDIRVQGAPLTLNSSIVGSQGVDSGIGASCASSFSFQAGGSPTCGMGSVADPLFTNPAANDFHLLAGSPLIDTGDPATPSEATDLDGNARAIPILGCPARRDVGAYEFATNPLDCAPPPPPATTAPDTTVSGKRKVKTRKKKARISFTFSASEPGATFACSLDGAPFVPCISPFTAKVRRGAHTLQVRASDATGNVDSTPASFTTKVKRKKKRAVRA